MERVTHIVPACLPVGSVARVAVEEREEGGGRDSQTAAKAEATEEGKLGEGEISSDKPPARDLPETGWGSPRGRLCHWTALGDTTLRLRHRVVGGLCHRMTLGDVTRTTLDFKGTSEDSASHEPNQVNKST